MSVYSLLLIGLSLSMDAFAIAVMNGVAYSGEKKQAFITALAFAIAQAMMPVLGYLLGSSVSEIIEAYDHWVAFLLLAFIGGKMIFDGVRELRSKSCPMPKRLSPRTLIAQAIATSIDALAIGISFAALHVDIITASALIGATTFFCCLAGGLVGRRCGVWLQRYAVVVGGTVLVLLGTKILLEHTGIL